METSYLHLQINGPFASSAEHFGDGAIKDFLSDFDRNMEVLDAAIATLASTPNLPSQSGHGGQYLTTDGVNAFWAAVAATLAALSDVQINSPADGQALTYDHSSGKWKNATPASALSLLSDVTLTSLTGGQFLEYNGSAWVNHALVEGDVASLVSDLALKAPLASPALTGTPLAPTATPGTNTTQLATTAFVTAAVAAEVDALAGLSDVTLASPTGGQFLEYSGSAWVNHSLSASDIPSLAESKITGLVSDLATLASAISAEASRAAAAEALLAPLASPTLTGTPLAPTAAPGTNTTQLATTAFVTAAVAAEADALAGLSDVSLALLASGQVLQYNGSAWVNHALTESDVASLISDLALKAPLASPAFSGNPTAPTQAGSDNSTRLATTAYVKGQAYITSASIAALTDVTLSSLASGDFLRYSGSAWVNAHLISGDIPNLDASKISTGLLALARGGTGVDLSGAGGAHNFLAISAGHVISAVQPAAADLSDGTTGSGAVVLADSPALTGTPTAPTQATADNSTALATTGYVQAQGFLTTSPSGLSQLVSGGNVIWTGGLTFSVATATYLIAGISYISPTTTVTLQTADPTNPRLDVVIVDNTGTVSVLTGTPAETPSAPTPDPLSQLALTVISIPAASSTPANVTELDLYLENTEYTSATNAPTHITLASTNNPFAGTKCIEATAAVNGDYITLTKPSGSTTLSAFSTLSVELRLKASLPNQKSLSIFFLNGSAVVGSVVGVSAGSFGLSNSNTSSYQLIVIPLANFNVGSNTITALKIQVTGGGQSIGFYLDNILIQSSTGIPNTTNTLVRGTVSLTTGTLVQNQTETGSITLGKSSLIYQVALSQKARVRLYSTAAKRDADLSRAAGTKATSNSGLLLETIQNTTSLLTLEVMGGCVAKNMDSPVTSSIYYAITNLDITSAHLTVTFSGRFLLES